MTPSRQERVARAQGFFFLAGGLWPLLQRRSFEAVTGPKVDFWLVKTVGLLLSVIGFSLLRAARQARITPELRAIGAGSAAALGAIDVVYAARGRISPVYLIDGAAQITIAAAWLRAGDGADAAAD
jgi:hypothetical protein